MNRRKGYVWALFWIADNDEPTIKDIYQIKDLISVALIADMFGKSTYDVAEDIISVRNGHLTRRMALAIKRMK